MTDQEVKKYLESIGGCTEEQWKLIGEAERKSATICEYCGTTEDVKLYTDGWHTTECLSCRNKK